MSEHLKRSIKSAGKCVQLAGQSFETASTSAVSATEMVENKENVTLKVQVEQSSGIAVFWSDRLHI